MAALNWMKSYKSMEYVVRGINEATRLPKAVVSNPELDNHFNTCLVSLIKVLMESMRNQHISQKERDEAADLLCNTFILDENLREYFSSAARGGNINFRQLMECILEYRTMNEEWNQKDWPREISAKIPMCVNGPLNVCKS
jgi:hypothetical protein